MEVYFDGKCSVSFHFIGIAQLHSATQGQSFTSCGKWNVFVLWLFSGSEGVSNTCDAQAL